MRWRSFVMISANAVMTGSYDYGEVARSILIAVAAGGDRLPWVKAELNGLAEDNFTPLTSLDWQVHVYGEAATEIHALCQGRKLPLHVFPWRPEIDRTGLQRHASYLVRPD